MSSAAVKLLLTPALIAIATLLARRWGPGVGGTIAGLPLTSTPVSIFLALEQGLPFAAAAAVGTLLGLLSQAGLCLAYSLSARRTTWIASAGAGVAAFFACTIVLSRVSLSPAIAFAVVCAFLILTAALIPAPRIARQPAPSPGWDLPARMTVATLIVVGLTTVAPALGPAWTGLLSPFPVFALVLGAFTHETQGAGAASHLLRGIVLGSLAHAAMFVVVASRLVASGLAATYLWACLAAIAVNAAALWIVSRSARAPRSTARPPARS